MYFPPNDNVIAAHVRATDLPLYVLSLCVNVSIQASAGSMACGVCLLPTMPQWKVAQRIQSQWRSSCGHRKWQFRTACLVFTWSTLEELFCHCRFEHTLECHFPLQVLSLSIGGIHSCFLLFLDRRGSVYFTSPVVGKWHSRALLESWEAAALFIDKL